MEELQENNYSSIDDEELTLKKEVEDLEKEIKALKIEKIKKETILEELKKQYFLN